jgi:PAS domain S-box-containing protein
MPARILIADNDEIITAHVARALRQRGYEQIEVVDTAQDAVSAAHARPPDLVLIGIQLQGEYDGIEAARRIVSAGPIPIVFLTEEVDEVTAERARSVQPRGYVLKPIAEAELHHAVEAALPKLRTPRLTTDLAAATPSASEQLPRSPTASVRGPAVFQLDAHGHVRACNHAAEVMYGYTNDTLVGRPFAFLASRQAVLGVRLNDTLERAAAQGTSYQQETHRRGDGTEFLADITVTALRNQAGVQVGFAALVRDASATGLTATTTVPGDATVDRKMDERAQELARVRQELDAFTYSVAHDLRAPLRGVLGYLDALREDHASEMTPPALAYLQRGIECGVRMQMLMDDLLKLSRINRQELEIIPTALGRIVAEVIAESETHLNGRHIEWQVGELPTLSCDSGLVRRLFANLVSNAVKFTRPQSSAVVHVHHQKVDGEDVLVVRDNGVGFDLPRAANLFTPFFRLHTEQEFEGTGTGLAIAQRIVHRHGGRIWADAALGKGATFYFTLAPRRDPVVP